MILTKIEIDNLFGFKDAKLDLSIKRKSKYALIQNECLEGFEHFNYKKVCIISGPNASGKTSFGRLLFLIQKWVTNPSEHDIGVELKPFIRNRGEKACLAVDAASPTKKIAYRIKLSLSYEHGLSKIVYAQTNIRKNDTVLSSRKRLDEIEASGIEKRGQKFWDIDVDKIRSAMLSRKKDKAFYYNPRLLTEYLYPQPLQGNFPRNADHGIAWQYYFSQNTSKNEFVASATANPEILYKFLSTFDPSIKDVRGLKAKGKRGYNAFEIIFSNGDPVVIDLDGEPTGDKINRLSKGTYESISIGFLISYLIQSRALEKKDNDNRTETFFIDEKLTYSHSELEKKTLNLLVEKLPKSAQLFYTTHNLDIFDLNFPIYSFALLAKDGENSYFIMPEDLFKKNDRGLKNFIENNIFETLPDSSNLDDILYME